MNAGWDWPPDWRQSGEDLQQAEEAAENQDAPKISEDGSIAPRQASDSVRTHAEMPRREEDRG